MRTTKLAIAAAAILVAGAAGAEELRPTQGYSIHFGEVSGTVYYDKQGANDHLVATMNVSENLTPVRFETNLAPGQSALVSVPRGPGQTALEVEFRRNGDHIFVMDGETVTSSIR